MPCSISTRKKIIKTEFAGQELEHKAFGRNVVTFKVEGCDRHFAVHEDLLCATSGYFRQQLQNNREPIEGDCSICKIPLDPRADDVNFCRAQCGQNFHETCIGKWNASNPDQRTCPMCRSLWKQKSMDVIVIGDYLNSDDVQRYVDWLYSGDLQVEERFYYDDEYLDLLAIWTIASKMEDKVFRYAIIAQCIETMGSEGDGAFWPDTIHYAFNGGIESMQKFIVEAFPMKADVSTTEQEESTLPIPFVRALLLYLFQPDKSKHDLGDLLFKHTDGHYALEEEKDDNDETVGTEQPGAMDGESLDAVDSENAERSECQM